MKRAIALALIVLGIVGLASAEELRTPLQLKGELTPGNVTVGERLRYSITVATDTTTEVETPRFLSDWGNSTVKESGSSVATWWGKKKQVFWYDIESFTVGKENVPRAEIRYRKAHDPSWQTIQTDQEAFEVKSLLGQTGAEVELKDIKPPVGLPPSKRWLLAGLLVLACLGGFLLWRMLAPKKAAETYIPPRPAHEIAYEELEELQRKNLLAKGKIKEYYGELSGILRHYLENRFQLRAPEMTTEEFLLSLKSSSALIREHQELLKDFLSHCDMVKFACYAPVGKEIEDTFASAKKLVDQTKVENVPTAQASA